MKGPWNPIPKMGIVVNERHILTFYVGPHKCGRTRTSSPMETRPARGNPFFRVYGPAPRAESEKPVILSIDLILKILQIEIYSAILDTWTGGKGAYL